MYPLVSIIIPTYNRENEIKIAIESVQNQSYKNWELIIIDNFSDDGTEMAISKINDSKIKFFKNNNYGVIAKSRNLGIKKSNGDIIAFLDSDDWWKSNKLELSVKYILSGSDFVFHRMFLCKSRSQKFFYKKTYSYKLDVPIFENLISKGSCIPNSSVTLSRKLIDRLIKFDESKNLIGAEDFEGWLRLSKLSNKFTNIPITLGYCLIDGNNFSNDNNSLKNLNEIEKKYIVSEKLKNITAAFDYSYARIFFRKKLYNKSLNYFKSTIKKKPSIRIFLFSIISILIIWIRLILSIRN